MMRMITGSGIVFDSAWDARRARFSRAGWRLALVLLAVIPAVILPGDAPFINDDAWLLLDALNANEAGTLATHGLMGTRGVYGPLPMWIYQLMLFITHDPVVLVILHAVILCGAIAFAVHGVARVSGLWPWFAAVLVASPYLWFYARLLWDNTFNLAFTALAFSSYGAFLAHRSRIALAAAVTLLFATALVHAMSIAFIVPMAAHMIFFERRALWRHRLFVLPALLLLAVLSWRYWRDFATIPVLPGLDPGEPFFKGFLFAFTGARLLGATGLGYFVGDGWHAGTPIAAAVALSALLLPLAWTGAVLAAVRVVHAVKRRSAGVPDHLAGIALAVVLAQALLDGFMRAFGHPHYHNATWIAHAFLAWISVDALAEWRAPLGRRIAGSIALLLVIALLSVTAWMLATLHASGGTRGIGYGTTLTNQLEVVRDLGKYPQDIPIITDVTQFRLFPHALGVLRFLQPPPLAPPVAARKLLIRYRSSDPSDAHVEIVAVE
jgi:hypothetical protein